MFGQDQQVNNNLSPEILEELKQYYIEQNTDPRDFSTGQGSDFDNISKNITESSYSPNNIEKMLKDKIPENLVSFFILKAISLKTTWLSRLDVERCVMDYDILIERYYLAVPCALRDHNVIFALEQSRMLFFLMLMNSYKGFKMYAMNTTVLKKGLMDPMGMSKSKSIKELLLQ